MWFLQDLTRLMGGGKFLLIEYVPLTASIKEISIADPT